MHPFKESSEANAPLARNLDHLLATSERSIPAAPGTNATPNPVSRILKAIGPATAALLVMAVFVGAPAVCRAADIPIYLYSDVSSSARAEDVIHILKNFVDRLSSYEGPDVLVVSIIPFFEDAFMATPAVRVSIAGDGPVDCPATVAESEIAKLSKTYAEASRRDNVRQCDELRAQARRSAALQRSVAISLNNCKAMLLCGRDSRNPIGLSLPGKYSVVISGHDSTDAPWLEMQIACDPAAERIASYRQFGE